MLIILFYLENLKKDYNLANKYKRFNNLYDKNKTHNKKKYNIGNYGAKKDDINYGTIGDHTKLSKTIEKTTKPATRAIKVSHKMIAKVVLIIDSCFGKYAP